MKKDTTRRRFLQTISLSSGITAGGNLFFHTVSAQEDGLEASNDQLRISLTDIDSHAYISAFEFNGNNLFSKTKQHEPAWDPLEFSETVNSGLVTADSWEGYRTERLFEYDFSEYGHTDGEDNPPATTLRIEQTTSVSDGTPIAVTEVEITNEGDATTSIRRPESHIHNGWTVSRLPPLKSPRGSHKYHIEGEGTRDFEESELWYVHDLSSEQRFITYFDDEQAITTSYIDGPSDPIQAVTHTTADVDGKSDLPRSEENPPARQTPGFSVNGLDLCVEQFSLGPGETVNFTTASIAHAGGDGAVARAEELAQTAESLWEDQPLLQEGSSENPLATVFQQAGDQSDNPLFLGAVSTGILGVGYGAYRKFQSDSEPAPDTVSHSIDSSSDSTQSMSDDTSPVIDSYSEITLDQVVSTTDRVQLQSGVVDQQPVWVLTPRKTSNETIDTERLSAFSDRVEPWAGMDSHPYLVSIFGTGSEPIPWAAIEDADDSTLLEQVGQLSINETIEALQEVCEALHHVHRYGTVYGNLTTNSVLYTDDEGVKLRGVLDQFEEPDLWYNAPEEFNSESTEQSTVYRVGLIAYELLTRTLPYPTYPNGSAKSIIQSHELISPSEQVATLPGEVDEILLTALSAASEDRYETVLHLRDELSEI
jgi:hypothetical protein